MFEITRKVIELPMIESVKLVYYILLDYIVQDLFFTYCEQGAQKRDQKGKKKTY
jgi:hypothetical protein